jgi:hypothetical protein
MRVKRGLPSLLCLICVQVVLVWPFATKAGHKPRSPEPLALAAATLGHTSLEPDWDPGRSGYGGASSEHTPSTAENRPLDSSWWIENIGAFLEKCPTQDLAFDWIRDDFKLRRNGSLVAEPSCSEPISEMPLSAYTDELIMWQALRLTYYMDLGQSGHLPWTGLNLYDWLSSKVAGINISDTASYDYCCDPFPDGYYIVVRALDDLNREWKRKWVGMSATVALLMHEARHMDGYGHIWCDGEFGGDANYDESDLTAFGIQWWLVRHWLDGDFYVSLSCLEPEELDTSATFHLSQLEGWRDRFCYTKPPETSMPSQPGGQCRPAPQPLVSFVSSSPDWLGQTSVFTNTSLTGDTVEYGWYFGDYWIYGWKDATHTFEQPGLHTVILSGYSATGMIQTAMTATIFGPPSTDFVADPTTGSSPLAVAFTDHTTTTPSGDPSLTYLWQFGDGATSQVPNPTHTYVESGTYTITLTVHNAAGNDTETKKAYVTVREAYRCRLPLVLRNVP